MMSTALRNLRSTGRTLPRTAAHCGLSRAPGSTRRPLLGLRGVATLYNASVAGLTEDQTEFRAAVTEFAQREIAPRAAEVDRSNNFPAVRVLCSSRGATYLHCAGFMGEIR